MTRITYRDNLYHDEKLISCTYDTHGCDLRTSNHYSARASTPTSGTIGSTFPFLTEDFGETFLEGNPESELWLALSKDLDEEE